MRRIATCGLRPHVSYLPPCRWGDEFRSDCGRLAKFTRDLLHTAPSLGKTLGVSAPGGTAEREECALMSDEHYEELARRLAAAWVSCQAGITLAYAYKRYVPGHVGPFWIDVAKAVSEAMRGRPVLLGVQQGGDG